MTAPTIRVTNTTLADHYTWGGQCDGWHLLQSPSLSVIAERMPPRSSEISHRHSRAQQFFYVLSGELVIACNNELFTLRAREGAHVPPLVVHQARNDSGSAVEFLVISEPPSHGDREYVE